MLRAQGLAALVSVALSLVAGPAFPQTQAGDPEWVARKCALYAEAWSALTAGEGSAGLRAEFIDRHDAFLASGCSVPADVCPRTPAELAAADTVSMMAVAEGLAGSFLPFACR